MSVPPLPDLDALSLDELKKLVVQLLVRVSALEEAVRHRRDLLQSVLVLVPVILSDIVCLGREDLNVALAQGRTWSVSPVVGCVEVT